MGKLRRHQTPNKLLDRVIQARRRPFFSRPKTHTHTGVKGERNYYIIIITIYVCIKTLTLKHKSIITPENVSLIKFVPQKR